IGNEYLYQTQAQANIEAMNAARVRKVIATCPHCFNTIKNEFPQFGGTFEVVHHTQLLARDRKSTRLNSSHGSISYAVFCLKKKSTRLNDWHGRIYSAVLLL